MPLTQHPSTLPQRPSDRPIRDPDWKWRVLGTNATTDDPRPPPPPKAVRDSFTPVPWPPSRFSLDNSSNISTDLVERDIPLSAEQSYILDVVTQGKSVFYTGGAGTGKSLLMRRILREALTRLGRSAVGITASTGIAAVAIGGSSIHSWAGLGYVGEDMTRLRAAVMSNKAALNRLQRASVLVIDEVGMLSAQLWDGVEEISRLVRNNNKPFGGLQLIVCGDFSQLAPVYSYGQSPQYAFMGSSWSACFPQEFLLTLPFRQKDQSFIDILSRVRTGALNPMDIIMIKSLKRRLVCPIGIEPVQLFCKRDDVSRANAARLSKLDGPEHIYPSEDLGDVDVLANQPAPEELRVAVGAQVLYLRNRDQLLVNGRVGFVVAVVRCVDWTGDVDTMNVRPGVDAELPVVRFPNSARDQGFVDIMVYPETFEVRDEAGLVIASRTQLPLILAWVLSIHKCQGQDLDWVRLDLRQVFAPGQAYTGMSRAKTMNGLQILNFSANKVITNNDVLEWYAGRQWAPFE